MLLSAEILLILKITLQNAKNALQFLERTFRMHWAKTFHTLSIFIAK